VLNISVSSSLFLLGAKRLNECMDRVAEVLECGASPIAVVCPNVHYVSWREAQLPEQREKMFKAVRPD